MQTVFVVRANENGSVEKLGMGARSDYGNEMGRECERSHGNGRECEWKYRSHTPLIEAESA